MQDIWVQNIGWVDELPTQLCQRWNIFLQSYSVLDQVRIPRWVSFHPEFRVEHPGFCDAWQSIRSCDLCTQQMGHATMVHFLMAKTRVSPVKTLELCEALLLSETAEASPPSMPWLTSKLYC